MLFWWSSTTKKIVTQELIDHKTDLAQERESMKNPAGELINVKRTAVTLLWFSGSYVNGLWMQLIKTFFPIKKSSRSNFPRWHRFSADSGQIVSCDIIKTHIRPNRSSLHVWGTWARLSEKIITDISSLQEEQERKDNLCNKKKYIYICRLQKRPQYWAFFGTTILKKTCSWSDLTLSREIIAFFKSSNTLTIR